MTSSAAEVTTDQAGTPHQALIDVDRIIGLRAESETARAALAPVQQALEVANRRLADLEDCQSRLEQQAAEVAVIGRELDDIKRSEAWRIGRTVTRFAGKLRPAGKSS